MTSPDQQVQAARRSPRIEQAPVPVTGSGARRFWATLDADSVRPYLPDLPVLLPVASFQRRDYQLRHPPRLPVIAAPVAVDTGAFAWFRNFTCYHFSAEQLADWIAGVRPRVQWAVIPDRPTEDLEGDRAIRRAQDQTTEAIVHVLDTLLDVPWCWTPVLQGRTLEDYLRHAIDLAGIIHDLAAVYASRGLSFRVGLGSLCRRGQSTEIRRIVAGVAAVLPGVPLHLFGAKLDVLAGWGNRPRTVVSCDSAAWNGRFGTDIPVLDAERRRFGLSQRQYTLQVALPRYAARVESLFDQQLLPFADQASHCEVPGMPDQITYSPFDRAAQLQFTAQAREDQTW